MRRRLSSALAWRLAAVTNRLDTMHARLDAVLVQLDRLELRLDALDARASETIGALDELRRLASAVPQAAADASVVRSAIELHIRPTLRAIADEESENRRRLFALRASPAYEQAYADPDPLVTVTVPTLGRRDALISRALPSLLSQTHTNLEVLVVGDAAGSSQVEEAIAALGDPRVRYVQLTQRLIADLDAKRHWLVGSTMGRNEAIRRARGRWLVHFDDDDHLRPDAIASLLALAREQHVEVAYGGYEQHEPGGLRTTQLGFPPRWGNFAWPGALMHGGLRFLERELFAISLELPGDVHMLERALRVGVRFALLDEVVLDYFPSTLWRPSAGD